MIILRNKERERMKFKRNQKLINNREVDYHSVIYLVKNEIKYN